MLLRLLIVVCFGVGYLYSGVVDETDYHPGEDVVQSEAIAAGDSSSDTDPVLLSLLQAWDFDPVFFLANDVEPHRQAASVLFCYAIRAPPNCSLFRSTA